jgi:hypothetical protein
MHMHRTQKLKATNGDVAFKFVLVMMLQLTVAIMDPLWSIWNEYKGLAGFHVMRYLREKESHGASGYAKPYTIPPY